MTEVNILVDVHYIRPAWALALADDPRLTSMYRVYVDNNLLTERTWLWNDNNFVQENIWLLADKTADFTLKIEPILKHSCHGEFKIENFTVTNIPFTCKQNDDLSISFTLQ